MPNPKLPGGSFTACVNIMKEKGYSEESAKRICGKLQAKSGEDSQKRNLQPIASEGVLPYWENGKVVMKLKTWENLKSFDGIEIPVIDEHPKGLVNDEHPLEGFAKVIADEKEHILYADIYGVDEMPLKKGYSIGFVFNEVNQQGKFNNVRYDSVQEIIKIDHLALTNAPRSPVARATNTVIPATIAGDSATSNVVKYSYCIDNYIAPNTGLEGGNLTLTDENSSKPATAVDLDALKEIANLRAKIAEMEAIKKANDSYNEQIQKLKNDLEKIKTERDSAMKILKEQKAQKLKEASDSLIKAGVDAKELDNKSEEYILGRYDQLQHDSKSAPTNIQIENPSKNEADSTDISYFGDLHYNAEKGVWE